MSRLSHFKNRHPMLLSALLTALIFFSCAFMVTAGAFKGSPYPVPGGTLRVTKSAEVAETSEEATTVAVAEKKDDKDHKVKVKDKDGKEITVDLDDPNVKVNADGSITTPSGTYKPPSTPEKPPGGGGSGGEVAKIPIYCHDGAHPITRQEPVYETRPIYETQPVFEWRSYATCNTCGADITGFAGQHLLDSLYCESYSTGQRQVQVGTQQVQVGTQQVQTGTKTVTICAERKIVGYR